jgi:SAM-dependent methyltransferase
MQPNSQHLGSDNLLYALAELKGEWFCDSYQRFEHPNYIQKNFDLTLELYSIKLKGLKILDFGCGFGVSSYLMIKRGANQIVATDLEEKNLVFARRLFDSMGYGSLVELRPGQLDLRLDEHSFDLIWLQAVTEHLLPGERRAYFQEFWKALRPNGLLVVTETPNRFWPYETHTTGGRWFISWMKPEKVFQRMRNDPRFKFYSDTDFYRSGIIGSTYGQLLDYLGRPRDCEQLTPRLKGYVRLLCSRAIRKSMPRRFAGTLYEWLEPVAAGLFKRPVTAFMPYLNQVAFRKLPRVQKINHDDGQERLLQLTSSHVVGAVPTQN